MADFFHSALVFAASESSGRNRAIFLAYGHVRALWITIFSVLSCRYFVGGDWWGRDVGEFPSGRVLSSIYGFRRLPRNIILGSLQTVRRLLLVFVGQSVLQMGCRQVTA